MPDRKDLLRYWIVEHEDSGARPVAVRDEANADDYRVAVNSSLHAEGGAVLVNSEERHA
jgi:uncharacterized protein (DUF1330 family)